MDEALRQYSMDQQDSQYGGRLCSMDQPTISAGRVCSTDQERYQYDTGGVQYKTTNAA